MKRSRLSRPAAAFCITILTAVNLPSVGADNLMPEASPGFVPKMTYSQDVGTVIRAITDTLSSLSIPIASSSDKEIVTDYVDGPTTQTSGRITHSRYRFMIGVRPGFTGGTKVSINVRTEASSGPDGAPLNWHNVSFFNLGVENKTRAWLYEKVEQTLSTGSMTAGSMTTSTGKTTTSTGPTTTSSGLMTTDLEALGLTGSASSAPDSASSQSPDTAATGAAGRLDSLPTTARSSVTQSFIPNAVLNRDYHWGPSCTFPKGTQLMDLEHAMDPLGRIESIRLDPSICPGVRLRPDRVPKDMIDRVQ